MSGILESPLDNLPAAAGKRRRGRPRKQRIEDVAESASAVAATALPLQVSEVKAAIKEAVTAAVKRPKRPGPETEKTIESLETEIDRAAVKQAVREEKGRGISPGVADKVRETLAKEIGKEALATEHGQSHPFWHLLRLR